MTTPLIPPPTPSPALATDPGVALRRLAQQYGSPAPTPVATSSTAASVTAPGDALRALAQQYGVREGEHQPAGVPTGDIDLREPGAAPGSRSASAQSSTFDNALTRASGTLLPRATPRALPGPFAREVEQFINGQATTAPTPNAPPAGAPFKRPAVPSVRPDETATSATTTRLAVSPDAGTLPPPPGPPLRRETTPVPAQSRTGMSTAKALGLDDESLPGRVANALGDMAAHPIKTVAGFVTAPIEAAITLDKAAAEQDAANAIAMTGGDASIVKRTVTPDQAAIAAAQLASLALGPELGRTISSVASRMLGETAGNVLGETVAGAGVGGVYSPQDPAVGAVLGGALGGGHAGVRAVRGTPLESAVPAQPVESSPIVRPATSQAELRRTPQPEQDQPLGEALRPAPPATQPPSTLEPAEPPAPRAGDALRELARKYSAPREPENAPAPVPVASEPPDRVAEGPAATPTQGVAALPNAPPEPIASAPGRATRVLLRDGQALPAEYRVVSADDLTSSHDPFSFTPSLGYPEGVQGRDYLRNKAAQAAVAERTMAFNPDIALNPSESAGEGVPTILPNGTVLAGNERSMLPRRAAVYAPDRYRAYVDQLKAKAGAYGIDPATIDATRNPVLVRVLTDPRDVTGGPTRWAEINRLSDEATIKAKSAIKEGSARAARLAQASDALTHLSDTLEPEQTVASYLGTSDGREFVRQLVQDGVLTTDERSRLTDATGALTEDGRLAVRRMLLSTAVNDPAVLLDAPASAVQKIEQAVPAIVATKGTPYDPTTLTTAALRILAEAHDTGMSVRDLEAQGALFGETNHSPTVTAFAQFLDDAKPTAVREAFRRYATLAREASEHAPSSDLFGGTGYDRPIDAFNAAFGFAERGEPVAGTAGGLLESRAPLRGASGELMRELPIEQRGPTGAPTRAGELLAEARSEARSVASPRETGAGPALGGPGEPATPDIAVRHVNRYLDALRKIFAPASRGPEAMTTALTVREHDAALVHRYEQAKAALMMFARTMDRLPVREQLDFIDRLETGRPQASAELTKLAATIRSLLDSARDEIRALGTGQLEHWIEHYFPHIWADPERARSVIASIMGKRSLTGPGSFLKHRTIPTIREGIEAGLVPVTFNPIDLTLLKLREMHRYLAGQRILAELKSDGRLRFVNSFSKPPAGLEMIDDKLSTVYGPPKVSVVEAYDHFIRQGLEGVMRVMGITHERRPNIGGGSSGGVRLGFAQGDKYIATRSATDLSVLQHELGHALDARLKLWDRLHQYEPGAGAKVEKATKAAARRFRVQIDAELRALADLRHEGLSNVSTSQHEYVRSRPEKIANAIMGLLHAPERMRDIAPTVDAKLRAILATDPVTAKLLEIKPSFRHEADTFDVRTPGMVVLGHWYAPERVARVVNNYLSPGISSTAIGPYFDVYRGAGNLLNMVQLGLSAYHLGFTSLDAAVSRTALGLLQLRAGEPIEAAKTFASVPASPVTTAIKGYRLKQAYLHGTTDPVLAQLIDGLEAAGGRVKMDEFYGGGAWRQARLALHEGRYGVALGKAVPGAIEQSTAWLMQHVVPWQKLGVFYDLAHHELAKLPPGADRMQVRQTMARVWDSVENRMGQLTYNNLFWHRYLKDALMASVRSVGWNLGTIRELGGGALDIATMGRKSALGAQGERFALTPRASYVVALPVTVALAGGVLHFLYTGKAPQGLKDWFYPRTGRKNPDGSDERVQLPSYLRDVRDYARSIPQTITNKVNPALGALAEAWENRDFFGDEIRNPTDPVVTQLEQEANFVARTFEPFGTRNMRQELRAGQSVGTAAQNFVGITPAPRDVVRSPAMNLMHDFLSQGGTGGLTPEQAETHRFLSGAKAGLRAGLASGDTSQTGQTAAALRALADRYGAGDITARQAKGTLRSAAQPSAVELFKRLTPEQAVRVYQLATPAERQMFGPVLITKLRSPAARTAHIPRTFTP